jgi:hypothetical protein
MSDQRAHKLQSSAAIDPTAEEITVRPPFDPAAFARESDVLIRSTPPSARPTAPPPPQYTPSPATAPPSSGLGAVPELVVAREDLEWFDVTPYARSILRYVDGRQSIEAICARACLKADEVVSTIHQLERDGVITLRR